MEINNNGNFLSEYKESKDNSGRRCRNGCYRREIIKRYDIDSFVI
jgi:hypothetical protein